MSSLLKSIGGIEIERFENTNVQVSVLGNHHVRLGMCPESMELHDVEVIVLNVMQYFCVVFY